MFTTADQKRRLLFFIDSQIPTDSEQAEALQLQRENPLLLVCFRNAGQVSSNELPEKCDGVAGNVPAQYSEFRNYQNPDPEETELWENPINEGLSADESDLEKTEFEGLPVESPSSKPKSKSKGKQ